MADKKRRKKGDLPPGVKGPNQPPAQQPQARPPSGQSRQSLERASIPILSKLMAGPTLLMKFRDRISTRPQTNSGGIA